jgi:hypothetical protein
MITGPPVSPTLAKKNEPSATAKKPSEGNFAANSTIPDMTMF